MKIEYSSNSSGWSWWLSDSDWKNLEKAWWYVFWGGYNDDYSDRKCNSAEEAENSRFLWALAKFATIESPNKKYAIKLFESITWQDSKAEGCNCCGKPHNFYIEN